ncbi:aasdhppt [Symbiodinium natans]|uniref:holo-[acyl-carrier-protein] synthase n=1 Tax=Symbiodinium natans TaxID=878477 RepID=A0A812QRU5_9DINO|nr:aasdhppt [Symbiodinium natans]
MLRSDPSHAFVSRNFNFNVSHDGNWVVLASDSIFLVGSPLSAVLMFQHPSKSVENEKMRLGTRPMGKDLQAVLTDAERDNIKSCSSTMRYATFQRIWSAKEAVSKAIGQGLAFGLERMEVQLPGMLQENLGNLVLTALGLSRSEAPEPAAKKGRVKFSSLLENLQNGKTSNGLRHETHAQRTPEVQAQMQRIEIHIDGWPRPDWTVYQEELEGSWISVALGPVDEAVDANGTFRATFRLPGLGGPSDLQALQSKMKMEPMTEATRPWASVSDWTPQAEGFRILPVEALLPQEVTEQLAILRGRDMALAAGV